MTRRPRNSQRHGQALVELALTMPLLVLILAGIVESGLLISQATRFHDAVSQVTRSASEDPCDIDTIRHRLSELLAKDRLLDSTDLKVYVSEGIDLNGAPTITVKAELRLHPFAFRTFGSFPITSSATFRKEWDGPLP